jgi:hypothetical protein
MLQLLGFIIDRPDPMKLAAFYSQVTGRAIAARVLSRWAGELDSDTIAAKVTGRIPSQWFVNHLHRRKRPLIWKLRGLLTHPPAGIRRRAITRAYSAPG